MEPAQAAVATDMPSPNASQEDFYINIPAGPTGMAQRLLNRVFPDYIKITQDLNMPEFITSRISGNVPFPANPRNYQRRQSFSEMAFETAQRLKKRASDSLQYPGLLAENLANGFKKVLQTPVTETYPNHITIVSPTEIMKVLSQVGSDSAQKASEVTNESKEIARKYYHFGVVGAFAVAGVATSILSELIEKCVSRKGRPESIGGSYDEIVENLYHLDSVGKISMVVPEIAVSYNIGASLINLSHLHVYSSGRLSEQMSFSFGGCEAAVFFELGAAQCLKDLIKPYIMKEAKFLGCSHGSIVAAAMAMNLDIDRVMVSLKRINMITSKRLLGNVGVISDLLDEELRDMLSSDLSEIQERLVISTTQLPSLENILVDKFETKKDLINVIMASSHIPIVYKRPDLINGHICISGQFSEDLPISNSLTITISPTAQADICPEKDIFVRKSDKDIPDMMFKDGYATCKNWLHKQLAEHKLPTQIFQ